MANWHYYNKNGEKVGPISVAALKSLAQQGMITRETVLVNHNGRTLIAGEVNGLTFPEAIQPEITAKPTITPPALPVAVPSYETNPFPDLTPMGNDPFSSFPSLTSDADPFTAVGSQGISWNTPTPAPVANKSNIPLKPLIFGGIGVSVLLFLIAGIWMMSSSRPIAREQAKTDKNSTEHSTDLMIPADIDQTQQALIVTTDQNSEKQEHAAEDQAEIDKFCAKYGTDVKAKGSNDFTMLHYAVLDNASVDIFKFLVEQGADINAKASQIGTPLHLALQQNTDIEVVKLLVSLGADLKAMDSTGQTPLHRAAQNSENVDVLKYLAAQGADTNAKAEKMSGMTPFDFAKARKGKKGTDEIVKYLESQGGQSLTQRILFEAYGTDVHAKDEDGKTPLHKAAYDTRNLDVIKSLVSKGADVNAKDNDGMTPLHYSVLRGGANVDILKFLVEKGADVNAKQSDNTTPLHYALQSDDQINAIKFLVEVGADVKAKTKIGLTPLHVAVMLNPNVEVIKLLVSKGADVNAGDNDGDTPFLSAVMSSTSVDVLKFLIEQGAKTNDKNGGTPLHFAALSNPNADILKFLIEQGADVKAKDNDGATPLHYAAQLNENIDILKFLVSRGAEVNAKNDKDMTPLDYAMRREVIKKNTAEFVKYLTDQGGTNKVQVDNIRNENGNTPLHLMAFSSNIEGIKDLVVKGADVKTKNNNGGTPLHTAVMGNGSVDVVQFLIDSGADVNAKDNRGGTPLHNAAFKGKVEIVQYLISQGADMKAKTTNDMTPLELANKGNNSEVVEYLSGLPEVSKQTEKRQTTSKDVKQGEPSEKQKNTYWFGRMKSLNSDEFWLNSVLSDSVQAGAKRSAKDLKDTFFIHSVESHSSLDNTGLGYYHVVIVSFNGKRFKTETELREWIDKLSPDTIELALYSSRDNYKKIQKGKIKSKELRAKEFAQKMERGKIDDDKKSKAISEVAQKFQGQDRETVIKGLMQCNIRQTEAGEYFFDSLLSPWDNVRLCGNINVKKKTILPVILFSHLSKDWIFADSFFISGDNGRGYESGKVEFERETNKISNSVYCYESATLPFIGKIRDSIESIINNEGVKVYFVSERKTGGGIGDHYSVDQLKDMYEAIKVIESSFEYP